MVSRKAAQHRKHIKAVKEAIASQDRALWKAELTQQAYEVFDDLLYVTDDIKENEIKGLSNFLDHSHAHILIEHKEEEEEEIMPVWAVGQTEN
jgi:hypothetical protein